VGLMLIGCGAAASRSCSGARCSESSPIGKPSLSRPSAPPLRAVRPVRAGRGAERWGSRCSGEPVELPTPLAGEHDRLSPSQRNGPRPRG
jgi:hypothetical protein